MSTSTEFHLQHGISFDDSIPVLYHKMYSSYERAKPLKDGDAKLKGLKGILCQPVAEHVHLPADYIL